MNDDTGPLNMCKVSTNKWSHVALVFDRTNFEQVSCFVDGTLRDSARLFGPDSSVNNNAPLFIGKEPFFGFGNFSGRIDEVEIFQRALNGPEIKGIFEAERAGKCPPCVPAPSGLVSWWPGDGGAEDIQSKNDGTVQDHATFGPGLVNQAIALDGVGDFIQVADHPSLDIGTSDFTIDAWIQPRTVAGIQTIADKKVNGVIIKGYYVFLSAGGRLGLGLADGTFTNYHVPPAMKILPDGRWHFVSVSVQRSGGDGGSGAATFRVDQDEVSIPIAHPGSLANTAPFLIGGDNFNPGFVFNGNIDELELYNRALTSAEVLKIFVAGSSGKCKGCACDRIRILDPNAILGTAGNDNLSGTPGNDIICGFEGNDTIFGGGGNDCIDCGEGQDRTFGGPGDDLMFGGPGNDVMVGGPGNDEISGGDGRDSVNGGVGNDRLIGGSDDDRILGSAGGNATARGGSGNDQIHMGASGVDYIDGGPGMDVCLGIFPDTLVNCP